MSGRSRLTCIVPTVGRSPHLRACLQALLSIEGAQTLVAVSEGADLEALNGLSGLRILEVPTGTGFVGACNRALRGLETEFAALINDDAIVEPGWAEVLQEALSSEPTLAAVQGANLRLNDPGVIDGCGMAWNRRWQALQILHGVRSPVPDTTYEIFGVSATAAVFRVSALEMAAEDIGTILDPSLNTYYEDVDLACRLRARGFHALHVSGAIAKHAGGASSTDRAAWRYQQIYGNRLLVLARLLGGAFWALLPGLLAGDAWEAIQAAFEQDGNRIAGILRGWGRALRHLSAYAHGGQSIVPRSTLARFVVSKTGEPELQ